MSIDLKVVLDDALLEKTKAVVAEERRVTAELLTYLKEVERRFLFAKIGYSSLFEYVTRELGYSEASAQRRIASMRLLKELPQIEEKIRDGSLTLSNLAQAQKFLKQESKLSQQYSRAEKLELLGQLERKSSREAERHLAAKSSQPEVFLLRDQIKPVTATHSEIRFLANQELLDQLEEVRGLLAHQNPNMSLAELVAAMAKISIERLRWKKYAVRPGMSKGTSDMGSARSTSDVGSAGSTSDVGSAGSTSDVGNAGSTSDVGNAGSTSDARRQSRYTKVAVKGEVYRRDHYRCTYQDPQSGRRCQSQFALEPDHRIAFGMSGLSTVENLRVLCWAHNQLHAIETYGLEKMESMKKKDQET